MITPPLMPSLNPFKKEFTNADAFRGCILLLGIMFLTARVFYCEEPIHKNDGSAQGQAQQEKRLTTPGYSLLRDLSGFDDFGDGKSYKADAYIHAAATIQEMGKEKGSSYLLSLASAPKHSAATFILARMLFVPKAGREVRGPGLGAPAFWGRAESKAWTREPIGVVDGIPFLIVQGYDLAGLPEMPNQYITYCIHECDWNPVRFQPKTKQEKQQALKKLLASPKWNMPLDDYEQKFLADQIN